MSLPFPLPHDVLQEYVHQGIEPQARLALRLRYLSRCLLRLRMLELTRKYTGLPATQQTSYELYQAIMAGPSLMTEQEATELAGLEMECGGWILFDDLDPDDDSATFTPTAEWRALYVKWLASTEGSGSAVHAEENRDREGT